ncbi:MAG: Molybdate-binding periplasmic protein [Pseudomonadota bacterium]
MKRLLSKLGMVCALLPVLTLAGPPLWAGEVRVAVAANFTAAAREIGALFTRATGHRAIFSFGSTGQLYAQISQGAPFEVLLAADQARPARAVAEGHALAASRFTYATGRLVLFSRDPDRVTGEATLRGGQFSQLALANPATAPYGAAALATLQALGLYDALAPRIVQGNNIAQTYQFVQTGNAELGFVALAQLAGHRGGSRWLVPAHLHPPIAQDAVLLVAGAANPAARAFLEFLKGPQAAAVKARYGYGDGD